MKIKVTKDNVTIDKGELYHAGEYNIHDCTFEFSEEYTDVLVKKALFGVDNKFYEMSILNNQCEIPYDVLKSNGMVILGVYAYEVLEDKLKLRYSPMYDKFFVNLGSYQENIENQEEITSTQFEQYMQALQNGLADVQSSIYKLNKTTDNANNLIDDINKKLESGEFDGVGITTITSGGAIQQNDNTITPVTVNKTDGSQQTFNVSAKNGINGTDGTDGTNGQDGITPNLQIGTVTTLEPNEQATVTRTGTDEEPLFNFGIPRGQTYQVNNEDLQNIANQITSNANSEFNKNVDSKTTAFNNNAEQKTLDYNNNCISKINSFNQNSTQKLTEFNDNYTSKLNFFNSNANLRMDEYNANADNKIAEYDEHSQELNNKIIDTRNELERVKNDVLETGTDTDTFIHVEDSAMAEYQKLSVDGVCKQETTSGKNLLANTNGTTQTINGVTFTKNNDGTITANGTATAGINYYINVYNYTDIEPNTYYLSDKVIGESGDTYFTYYEFKNNDVYNLSTYAVKTRTISSKLEGRSRIVVRSGQTLNNIVFKPMLEIGSKETDFEPYTGGQASPSPNYPQEIKTIENSLKITSCNKNLFDKYNLKSGSYSASTGQWVDYGSRYCTKEMIKVKPNTNYIINNNNKSSYNIKNIVDCYDINKKYIGRISGVNGDDNKKSYIVPQNGMYFNITFNETSDTITKIIYEEYLENGIISPQLEQSNQATPYEQHLETQITANLPEGEFIGKINETYKDTLKVEYNEEDGQYHLNLYKRVYKNNSYNGESYNYYISTTARKDGNIECGELQTGQVVYYDGDETIIDLGVVDMPLSYNEVTNIFTDSDLLPQINAKYYRNFVKTVQNLQVNEKALKQELIDINNRLTALETAKASESEVNNDIPVE